jgi:His/Glu/Gln/Arg/opine family amino acid ABC transporter permease subunit
LDLEALKSLLDPSKDSSYRIIVFLGAAAALVWLVSSSHAFGDTFQFVLPGVSITLSLTLLSFFIAFVLGLCAALGMISEIYILQSITTFYVRVIRGIPVLVVILYIGLVAIPMISNSFGIGRLGGFARAVIALAITSGGYQAEIIRGGIQSIDKGQYEAARALGMRYFQMMRFVIMPQVIRIILPSLANEFIISLKDSSLASALGVLDLTRMGQLNVSRTRDTFTTWNIVTLQYLILTVTLSYWAEKLRKNTGE